MGGPRPAWLPNGPSGGHWAVLALQDYGDRPREFGVDGMPWPLGINTAARRETTSGSTCSTTASAGRRER
jgi:hypothetical protein